MSDQFTRDKEAAAAWARHFLATEGTIILDTETTGLGPTDEIIEIAIIDVAGETLIDTLVKPTIPIPADATAVHGITNEEVAGADGWPEIDENVIGLLVDAPAIAIYNLEYDMRMIRQTRHAHDLPPVNWRPIFWNENEIPKCYCAMHYYARWFGDWSDYHQSYRWQRLEGGHRALGDCLATLALIRKMAGE